MNLEWTNSGGGRGPGASDCQGVEAPGPLACARKNGHLIGDQTSEYDRRQSITQGGRGGNTRETEESAHPPGTNRDMGSGRGQQRGGEHVWDKAAETGTRHGEQRRVAEAGGCWRWTKSRQTTYHCRIGGGDKVLQR